MEADSADHSGAEDEESGVFVGVVTGFEEVPDGGATEGEIDVFSRAVDASEGFFVQEASEAVASGDIFEGGHDDLLVIGGDIGLFIDGGKLILTGRDFVVAGFDGDTELEHLDLAVLHKGHDAFVDRAEVVIFEFLAFGWHCAVEGAASVEDIRASVVKAAVDQEVLLFGSCGGSDAVGGVIAKELEDAAGLFVEGLHGAKQRGFLVEGFACPRDKGGGDAEG